MAGLLWWRPLGAGSAAREESPKTGETCGLGGHSGIRTWSRRPSRFREPATRHNGLTKCLAVEVLTVGTAGECWIPVPLPPPTASSLTFSLAMRRRENLRVLRDFPCEALHRRTRKQRRVLSLSAVFLSTSGLREFGTDFLCNAKKAVAGYRKAIGRQRGWQSCRHSFARRRSASLNRAAFRMRATLLL